MGQTRTTHSRDHFIGFHQSRDSETCLVNWRGSSLLATDGSHTCNQICSDHFHPGDFIISHQRGQDLGVNPGRFQFKPVVNPSLLLCPMQLHHNCWHCHYCHYSQANLGQADLKLFLFHKNKISKKKSDEPGWNFFSIQKHAQKSP